MNVLDKFRFALYYVGLLAGVSTGLHKTLHPINLHWRWQTWQHREAARRRYR